jgi:hypothetical protein
MSLPESRLISPDEAATIQVQAIQQDLLPMWSVTTCTSDLGEGYAARPFLVNHVGAVPMRVHLLADTIEALREQLPPGLCRLDRNIDDDPTIVEVWL